MEGGWGKNPAMPSKELPKNFINSTVPYKVISMFEDKNLKMIIAALLVVILITTTITLTNLDDEDKDLVTEVSESEYQVVPGQVFAEGQMQSETIILEGDDYEAFPITSPLLALGGIDTFLDWGNGDQVQVDDLSLYSSIIALTFFPDTEKAIVVEDYAGALLGVQLSVALEAPILYQGETTNEVLWRLGLTGKEDIISIGNTKYAGRVDASFRGKTEEGYDVSALGLEVADHTLAIMDELGIEADYITVANPNDHNESYADVPHLSAFAGTLAAYRGGIVLTVDANYTDINEATHAAVPLFEEHGHEARFLCMMGDAKALPFGYRSFECYNEDGFPDQNPVASDNDYVNFDDNPYTVELANGRLLNKDLGEMSEYMHRNIHYEDYLTTTSAPIAPAPTIRHTEGEFLDGWNNNAVVYCAFGAWFDPKAEHYCWREFYENAHFNTQDDSPESHTQYSDLVDGDTSILTHDFAMSNFVAIDADHGNKYSTLTFNSEDLREMPPNVIFGVSCMLGWTDNVDIQRSMTYTMMEKGCHAFLAASRITYGVISTDTVEDYPTKENDKAGNGLCRLFYEDAIANDHTVGEAMMDAKNDLMNTEKWDSIFNDEEWEINETVCWEYQCYGDPAFNPYEPVNEGS